MNFINQSNQFESRIWHSGSGIQCEKSLIFKELINICNDTSCKVFVGSDSAITSDQITFCSAACIYGYPSISKYFFTKFKVKSSNFPTLISRILEETRLSLEIANDLVENYKLSLNKIELHLDVSPFGANTKTSKFSDMLKGYVTGAGYNCRIKPFAWASQSVADRHSK